MISNLLIGLINNKSLHSNAKQMIIWGACVLIYEELTGREKRKEVIRSCMNALILHSSSKEDSISITACQALSTLTPLFSEFQKLEKKIIVDTITGICDNLDTLLSGSPKQRENIISESIYCMIDWLTCETNTLLLDPALSIKVFQVIERSLLGELVDPAKQVAKQTTSPHLDTTPVPRESTAQPDEKKKHKKGRPSTQSLPRNLSTSSTSSTGVTQMESLFDRYYQEPKHGSVVIREAAETFVFSVSHFYNNFPPPVGSTRITTQFTEGNCPALFYIQNDTLVLSFSQTQNDKNEKVARSILRDPTGKFSWDSIPIISPTSSTPISYAKPESSEITPIPKTDKKSREEVVDPLQNLLDDFAKNNSQILPDSDKIIGFSTPLKPDDSYAGDIQFIHKHTEDLVANEQKVLDSRKEARKPVDLDHSTIIDPISPFALARHFITHLGLTTPWSRKHLHLLEDGARMRRAIKDLDKFRGREVMKVGIIYVADGQIGRASCRERV